MGPSTPNDLPDFLESELLRIVDTADDDADFAPAIDRLIAAHPDQSMAIRNWMQAHRRQTGGGYGGFRIVGELGRGGMGVVYEAEEPGTGRRVAIKVIQTAQAFSPEGVERFRREARLAASIVHPRCVLVLTADLAGSEPFIVMEKTGGRNLQDVVDAGGAMPIDRALAAILDAADGLQAAHDLGVLHRDVKPSNLFVESDGRVKVGDFGLSRSLHGDLDLTQTGDVLGTPLYAAPEQLRGQRVDARADTYGLSATMFFLLTGQPPFGGKGIATIARILDEPAPREDPRARLGEGPQRALADGGVDARGPRGDGPDHAGPAHRIPAIDGAAHRLGDRRGAGLDGGTVDRRVPLRVRDPRRDARVARAGGLLREPVRGHARQGAAPPVGPRREVRWPPDAGPCGRTRGGFDRAGLHSVAACPRCDPGRPSSAHITQRALGPDHGFDRDPVDGGDCRIDRAT